MSRNLINTENFNINNLVYSKPEVKSIPGQKVSCKRVHLSYKVGDDLQDVILESPAELLSWGLAEQHDMGSNQLTGYQLPICLWSKNGPSVQEKAFTDIINAISEHTKKYLVDNRDELEMYTLELAELKKINPLYWKMEKGKIVDDKGPTLYAKCLYNKRNETITTLFINEDLNCNVNPLSVLGKQCYVKFALKIESIFFGSKISLQVKLVEVLFRPKETILRSLLAPSADVRDIKKEEEMEEEEDVDEEEYVEEEVEEEEEEEEEEVIEEVKPVPVIEQKEVVSQPKTTRRKKNTV